MSLFNAIGVAATSLEAQSARLNTISSNLANANTTGYRAEGTVFADVARSNRRGNEECGRAEFAPQKTKGAQFPFSKVRILSKARGQRGL